MPKLYSAIKKDMRTGDLIAWKSIKINSFSDFVLYLYQKICKVSYLHVGVIYKEGDRHFMVEATPPVVRLFPISMTTDNFFYIPCNIKENDKHKDILLRNIGKSYGIVDFVRAVIGLGTSDKEYYCSELADDFYRNIGYIKADNAGKSPDTIVRAVLESSKTDPVEVMVDRGNLTRI